MTTTRIMIRRRLLVTIWMLLICGTSMADEPRKTQSPGTPEMTLNIPTWTLGGKQLWTDELVCGQWRIQKNVLSGHFRLLDSKNRRRGWGTWETCLAEFDELKKDGKVPPMKRKIVLVLHGLGRSRSSMKGMARYLAQHGDYSVLSFSYASTRSTLAENAQSLGKVVAGLKEVDEINFVAHSMGNLVVRHLMGDQLAAARGLSIDSRIRRFVMLAPPNNGANLAERFQRNPVFKLVFGTGGRQFTKDWENVCTRLATPPVPFGIIAGGGTDGTGRNPWLEGDNDMVVTVQETRLPGAADFVVVPAVHTLIMDDDDVRKYTLSFLQHGYFMSADRRQPIPAEVTSGKETP